eukprot:11617511-Karenia_brevis.AAC.1
MREQEINGVRRDKQFSADAGGILREKTKEAQLQADTSTDLLLRYALQRRGLALDQAGIMSFTVHEKIVHLLFEALMRLSLIHISEPTRH